MEGQVREPQFLRHLVEMGQETFTGAIRLENEDVIKIIYFQDGQIISASTNDPAESVDEILLRGKKVTREHIQQALVKRKPEETLGDALLSAGFITRKELRWARRHQIVEVLRSAAVGEAWHYTVVPDYVSPRSAEGTNFQVEPLLIELVVTDPDRKHVDARLDGGEVRLRKAPSFESRYPSLGLNQDADRVAGLVDGKRTATEIAAEAGGNGFMNLKLLAALQVLGLLEINPKAQGQLEISFEDRQAAAGLLPGIEPQQPIAVPQWEVESDTGLELPAEADAIEWPEPEEASGEAEDLEIGSIDGLGVAEPVAPVPDTLDRESVVDDSISEPPPMVVEEAAIAQGFDDVTGGPEGDPETPVPIEEEVERALEWSPPIERKLAGPAVEGSIDRRDESWMPDDEEIAEAETIQHDAEEGRGGSRGRWIGLIVLLVIAGFVGGWWLWYRSGGEQPVATPQTGLQLDGTQEEMDGTSTGQPEDAMSEPARQDEAATLDADGSSVTADAEAPAAESEEPISDPPVAPAEAATQAPVAGASDDPRRAEYDRLARQYAADASSVPYTIQFEIVCQTSSVTLALNEGGSAIWFVPISYQGRPCFRVFWGRYPSESAARGGVDEIPSSLQGSRPVVIQPGRVVE